MPKHNKKGSSMRPKIDPPSQHTPYLEWKPETEVNPPKKSRSKPYDKSMLKIQKKKLNFDEIPDDKMIPCTSQPEKEPEKELNEAELPGNYFTTLLNLFYFIFRFFK